MGKKNNIHYVDNKKFYAEISIYLDKCKQFEADGKEIPKIPNYIAECIYKICNGLSYKHQFINYSYRDEMVCDALAICIKNVRKFDHEKWSNPFAFFTQCAWHAFVNRINIEKREQYVKYKSLENAKTSYDQHVFQDYDDNIVSNAGYDEVAIGVISSFEANLKRKKEIAKKKKGIETFIEEEIENV